MHSMIASWRTSGSRQVLLSQMQTERLGYHTAMLFMLLRTECWLALAGPSVRAPPHACKTWRSMPRQVVLKIKVICLVCFVYYICGLSCLWWRQCMCACGCWALMGPATAGHTRASAADIAAHVDFLQHFDVLLTVVVVVGKGEGCAAVVGAHPDYTPYGPMLKH